MRPAAGEEFLASEDTHHSSSRHVLYASDADAAAERMAANLILRCLIFLVCLLMPGAWARSISYVGRFKRKSPAHCPSLRTFSTVTMESVVFLQLRWKSQTQR